MSSIAIIEDDTVEHIFYKRFFSKTTHEYTVFSSFEAYNTQLNKNYDLLISDYYVNQEEVINWLHFFDATKGFVLSNRPGSKELKSAGINLYKKPLTFELLNEYLELKSETESTLVSFSKISIFNEFCDTDEEVVEMADLLLQSFEKAKEILKNNSIELEKKFFYHNLINQLRYFKHVDLIINRLRLIEEYIVEGKELLFDDREQLIIELTNRITQITQILKK